MDSQKGTLILRATHILIRLLWSFGAPEGHGPGRRRAAPNRPGLGSAWATLGSHQGIAHLAVYTCVFRYTDSYVYIWSYIYIYIYIYIHICIHIHMCIYIFILPVCIYVHIQRQRCSHATAARTFVQGGEMGVARGAEEGRP